MTKDNITRTLCERIIEEGKKLLAKGYNIKIVCEDPEIRERDKKRESSRE